MNTDRQAEIDAELERYHRAHNPITYYHALAKVQDDSGRLIITKVFIAAICLLLAALYIRYPQDDVYLVDGPYFTETRPIAWGISDEDYEAIAAPWRVSPSSTASKVAP
jgi:hypothetical protein